VFYWVLIFAVFVSGCGSESHDVENYGSEHVAVVLQDPEEHMGGYGRRECLVCHNTALNVHRDKGSPIDADSLNKAVRNNNEAGFCLKCHGPNGT
jgi:hypothetical protein